MVTQNDYKIGSIIEYRAFGGVRRVVKVDEKSTNIKDDEPGFGGVMMNGDEPVEEVWGYDSQIIRVVRR